MITLQPNSLSEAIIIFLGYGSASSPRQEALKLRTVFGREAGEILEGDVAAILKELGLVDIDWSTNSLESGGELAKSRMRQLHPDLSTTALDALKWKFTFDWR